MTYEAFLALPWPRISRALCGFVACLLTLSGILTLARCEWRDAVVILAGAMVNGAMAVPT